MGKTELRRRGWDAVGEVLEEKLLEEGSDGAGADADEDVVDSDLGVVLFALGIVEG